MGRLLVAIWNGFFGPSFGAELDANGFHLAAAEIAVSGHFYDFKIGSSPYANFLGLFYLVTTNSLFLGSLLSCIAWLLSALILVSSLRILSVEKSAQAKVMLVYSLLPSSVMFTAVTLREPYQLLFVNLALYAVLKICVDNVFWHWFTLIVAVAAAGSLHGGLFAFGMLLIAGTLLLVSMRGKKRISWVALGLMGVVAAFVLWYGFSLLGNISYNIEDGLGSAVESYQEGALNADARTHYKSDVTISGFSGLLFFIPVSLFQYLFEPFPWHISAASDVLLLLENILRGWLIWKSWKVLRVAPLPQRRTLLLIIFSYLALEAIWSLGTINWGTAARHHIPSIGLLLIAAFAYSGNKLTTRTKSTYISFKAYIMAYLYG